MKRNVSLGLGIVLLAALGGGAWYAYQHPSTLSELSTFTRPAPCAKPIPYSVGPIDSRFGLTKEEVVTRLADAAKLWNDAAGKPVLVYAPDDGNAMPVNFVYDARQQSVNIGQKIDTTEASQNAERTQIETLQQQYLSAQQAYAAAVASFNKASQQYAAEVSRVNDSGGADPATYERLNAEKASLKQQQQTLDTQGNALEAQGTALKQRIGSYNASVKNINQVVNQFNSTVGGDFEEGQYVREASGAQHIDIYAYKSESELLHSLAHEFGHAIGLEHNSNPLSIMYPYNKDSGELSADDLADLKKACSLP